MKRVIKSASRANSPKKYIYDICDRLGWRPPMFTDPAAGGYRIRYRESSESAAADTLQSLKDAAKELGIRVVRSEVKSGWKGEWFAYMVVPRYEPTPVESAAHLIGEEN